MCSAKSDTEFVPYYYRARYYDPVAGRFLSQDPIGFNGGLNLYAAGYNNPIVSKDPFGTCVIKLYFEHTGDKQQGIAYHTFLTVLDNSSGSTNSFTYVFRGGPAASGTPPPTTIVSADFNRVGISRDNPDTDKIAYSVTLQDDGCSCTPYNIALQQYEQTIDQLKIEYGWTHNSNSVTSDAINLLGLDQPNIPWWIGPFLPGWGNSLLPASPGGGGW